MALFDLLENAFVRFRSCVKVAALLYGGVVILLCFPYFQSHMLYLNAVKLPFNADMATPEKYGLAPNRTLNLHLTTADNERIGAWFILNDQHYQSLPTIPQNLPALVPQSLKERPTVLFLHGNAATRAFKVRVGIYKDLTTRWNANVLAIDYRGFADSTGTPSEDGLTKDARAAWDWLISNGAASKDILIMGHSLGTGVSSQLGAQLGREGTRPRGIVLMSPFSSIREVLEHYQLFGMFALMKPLSLLPGATQLLNWALVHKFDSLQAVPDISASVLIAHAENDMEIPASHSDILFDAYLAPHLPDVTGPGIGPKVLTAEEWQSMTQKLKERKEKFKQIVEHTDIAKFGTIDEFRDHERRVVLVKTLAGSHDYLPLQEGLQDIIKAKFDI